MKLNEKVKIMKCTCCGREHIDGEKYCLECGEVNQTIKIDVRDIYNVD